MNLKYIMLRLDRFATLFFFRRLVVLKNNSKVGEIPILMYHSISDDKELNVHSYFKLNTSPAIFSKHMKYLKENNYKVINLNNFEELKQHNKTETGRLVIITFEPIKIVK